MRDRVISPGRISMRDLGLLIFPIQSKGNELARDAFSDNDLLFKLPYSQLCRDEAKFQFQHLVDVASSAADQLETERRRLSVTSRDVSGVLSDAFLYLANGRYTFLIGDLQRAFQHHDHLLSL